MTTHTLATLFPDAPDASDEDVFVKIQDFPEVLTVQEAAILLRMDPRTVRAMLKAGDLAGNQRGHAIRVLRSSVVEWLCGKRRVPRSRRQS